MKAKKPLLLAVLILALLVVVLIVPAVASAKEPNPQQPVNWVKGNENTSKWWLPWGIHEGTTMNVQQLGDGTLKGSVLVKRMLEPEGGWPWDLSLAPTVIISKDFSPESEEMAEFWEWTGLDPLYFEDYAEFYPGTGEYQGANVVDFCIYLVEDWLPPGTFPFTTMPHRWLIYDFDDPERWDLYQVFAWAPENPYDINTPWSWIPMTGLWEVPPNCYRVHIAETDG